MLLTHKAWNSIHCQNGYPRFNGSHFFAIGFFPQKPEMISHPLFIIKKTQMRAGSPRPFGFVIMRAHERGKQIIEFLNID
jgi:hypothetical protein